jgi:hypothetical protein
MSAQIWHTTRHHFLSCRAFKRYGVGSADVLGDLRQQSCPFQGACTASILCRADEALSSLFLSANGAPGRHGSDIPWQKLCSWDF